MAKRHEDRKPGQRFSRGGAGGAQRKPVRKSAQSPAGGGAKGGTPRGEEARGAAPRRATGGSARRASGIVVTPSDVLPQQKRIAPDAGAKDGKVRLNHYLAQCGVASRRHADELIQSGRVEVNGEMVTELGVRVDPQVDDVRFDGSRLQAEKHVYVLFNKPKGVVCTNASNEQKKRVVDLLPTIRGRIFTVGRLDLDSEGLLLVTNDGEFAQEMTHPSFGIGKLYSIVVRGRVDEAVLGKARGGVWLAEGPTSGMQLRVERLTAEKSYLKVGLREGKNREIRRVFAKLGHPVLTLKRVRIGHLNLHGLGGGEFRFLRIDEVSKLRELARGEGDDNLMATPERRRSGGARVGAGSRGGSGARGGSGSRSGAGARRGGGR